MQVSCQVSNASAGAFQKIDDLYGGTAPTGNATKKGVVGGIWHYGAARKATATVGTVGGLATVTITGGTDGNPVFTSADIGHTVTGPFAIVGGLPTPTKIDTRSFVKSVAAGVATLGLPPVANGTGVPILIENSTARSSQRNQYTGTTLCSADLNLTAADTNAVVTGYGFAHGTKLIAPFGSCTYGGVTPGTSATLSSAAANAVASGDTAGKQTVSVGEGNPSTTAANPLATSARAVSDVSCTSGSPIVHSFAANSKSDDINLPFVSSVCTSAGTYVTGIPAATSITANITTSSTAIPVANTSGILVGDKIRIQSEHMAVSAVSPPSGPGTLTVTRAQDGTLAATALATYPVNGDKITVSANAIGTGTGQIARIGDPNSTSPGDGDLVAGFNSEIDLNPSLVDGNDPCSNGTLEGGAIQATWLNVDNAGFGTAPFGSYPDGSMSNMSVVGEFDLVVSVISFSGFVTQDTDGRYHVIFPFLPLTLAVCPGSGPGATTVPGLATTFSFFQRSKSQGDAPQGTGTPGTSIVRGLADVTTQTLGIPANPCTQSLAGDLTLITGPCLSEKANFTVSNGFSPVTKSAACIIQYPGYPDFKCGDAG